MAMTSKPSVPARRVVHVSSRAVGAYREILGRDFIVKSDRDIREQLLEDLRALTPKWTVIDTTAPGEPTDVYELAAPLGVRWAVVRDETVITILGEEQVARNLKRTWIRQEPIAEPEPPKLVALPSAEPERVAAAAEQQAIRAELEEIESTLSGDQARAAIRLAEQLRQVARRRATADRLRAELAAADAELAAAEKLSRELADSLGLACAKD